MKIAVLGSGDADDGDVEQEGMASPGVRSRSSPVGGRL